MTPRPRRLRRGVVVLPSAFTLGNLFLGIWAIVSASRGRFETAAWLIILASVADMLDGRVARFTRTGSEFGEELDSLVDAVSFGVAPSLILYFLLLRGSAWGWVLSFLYVAGAIIRLARFNVEQAGTAKRAFHGLPSPAAGVTLASFYPFTQTRFFDTYLDRLPWSQGASWLMIALPVLMVSNVLYPVVPKFGVRTAGGIAALVAALAAVVAAITVPALFFFPASLAYITWGLGRTAVLGFLERLPERDPLDDEDDEEEEGRELEYVEIRPRRFGRGRRSPTVED